MYKIILIIIIIVSVTHTQEKFISSPHSNRSGIICHNFVSYSLSNTQFERRLCPITFYSWKKSAENLSTIGVGYLGLPLPNTSLDSHLSRIQQDEILILD